MAMKEIYQYCIIDSLSLFHDRDSRVFPSASALMSLMERIAKKRNILSPIMLI